MSDFRVGSLSRKHDSWLKIGASDVVLAWVQQGVPLIFDSEPTPFEIQNRQFSPSQFSFVTNEIQRLESIGVIERCAIKPRWCSPIGCVPKKGGKSRLITDLRHLNGHCCVCTQQYIQYEDFLATVDYKMFSSYFSEA